MLCLLLGVPLAWLLARRGSGRRLLRALVTVPLVLPPVVGGVALSARPVAGCSVGRCTDCSGSRSRSPRPRGAGRGVRRAAVPGDRGGGALRGADRRYEEAAATLGRGRWTTFRRVTLPLVGPGIAAGAVLCWARALGEFGATITFAGNFPGSTQTMPLAVYLALETDPDAASCCSRCCCSPSRSRPGAAARPLGHRW